MTEPDAIATAVIRRMTELGWSAADLNDRAGLGNLDHVERFLTRRAPMTSTRLCRIFAALGLSVTPTNEE